MIDNVISQFATAQEATESAGIFEALGIDWQMLIFQIIGFLILVALMGKYIYPVLLRVVDERQVKIDESTKAAEAAEKKAEEAESKVEEALKIARTEAADIVATAKLEATGMIEKAESDAKKRSERIVTEAHESLEKDVLAARETLKNDTLKLVKQAASLATSSIADSKLDSELIKKSLEGAKK